MTTHICTVTLTDGYIIHINAGFYSKHLITLIVQENGGIPLVAGVAEKLGIPQQYLSPRPNNETLIPISLIHSYFLGAPNDPRR